MQLRRFLLLVVALSGCGGRAAHDSDASRPTDAAAAVRCGPGTVEVERTCVAIPLLPDGAVDAEPQPTVRDAGAPLACGAGTIEVAHRCVAMTKDAVVDAGQADASSDAGEPLTCGQGTIAVDHRCIPLQQPPECGVNDDCPLDASCRDGHCHAQVACSPGGACSEADTACAAGKCVPRCDSARCSSVHAGLVCADKLTVPVCLPAGSFRDSPCRAAPASACDGAPTPLRCVNQRCAIDCSETDKWPGYGLALCQSIDPTLICSAPAGYICAQPPPPALNPTAAENTERGTTQWQLDNPALAHEIEGYASKTSIDKGQSIALYVSTSAANYTIDVFRMGYYAGLGAKQVAQQVRRTGQHQITPAPDGSGTVDCDWTDPYVLNVPPTWVSGVYLAKLSEETAGKQSYIVFVVRDDARSSDYLFQSSVSTYQAYNSWGGKSLYDFNSAGQVRASKVSFNRPYGMGLNAASARGIGAGEFLTTLQASSQTRPAGWEYAMLRFLEREGYDVTYATNIDTHEQPNLLAAHKGFLSVGHDEYWSWRMRNQVETARDRFGTQLGFFSGNDCYWQVRFEADSHGTASRIQVGYKDETTDPAFGTPDEYLTTTRWALLPLSSSEANFIGVHYQGAGIYGDLVVDDDSSPLLAGTGLRKGDHLSGLLGYEVDSVPTSLPAGMSRIMHSPWSTSSESAASDSVAFAVPSGAWTFAAGSIQFAWGLDDFGNTDLAVPLVSTAAQQLTKNVLARFVAPRVPSSTPVVMADDFAGSARDSTRWSLGVVSEGAAAIDPNVSVVQNGVLTITPRTKAFGVHHNGVVTARTWDMTDGAATVELVQGPNVASDADTSFAVASDSGHWVRFSLEAGTLILQADMAGTVTKQTLVYNATQQRFLRLRHLRASEEFLWEISADGQAFSVARRISNTVDVTAMRVELEAGTFQSEVAPGTVVYDNFELVLTGFADSFVGPRRAEYWKPDVLSEAAAFDPALAPIQYAGRVMIRPSSGSQGSHAGGYVTARSWDLTGGEAVAEVSQVTAASAHTVFAVGSDGSNWVRFQTDNGVLYCQTVSGGVQQQSSVPYDAVAHRYWRLAHDVGSQQWVWSTSPDGATWTVQRSSAVSWPATRVRAELMAGTTQAQAAPGEARFESFRLRVGKFAP